MKVYLASAKTLRPIVVKLNQTSVNVVRSPEIAAHAPADGYAEQGVENGRKHAGGISSVRRQGHREMGERDS
jgi:hypothetical protein